METETEMESRDERKRKRDEQKQKRDERKQKRDEWKWKWDENWKQKVVIQIDSSYESNIFFCSIQCNFNNVLPKSDFIKVEPDIETEMETEIGRAHV